MKKLLLALLVASFTLHAKVDPLEGLWQGYNGEWGHVSRQLIALAETFPPDKYGWRPGAGVRSTGEVFMHIATANFWLLSEVGQPMPSDIPNPNSDKTAADKAQVISWLKRSLNAVQAAHAKATPGDLQKRVSIEGRNATVDGVYLRIIIHANEHMGQLVAYARINGIVPRWSEQNGK